MKRCVLSGLRKAIRSDTVKALIAAVLFEGRVREVCASSSARCGASCPGRTAGMRLLGDDASVAMERGHHDASGSSVMPMDAA
jgi:hypothetical protein